MTKKYHVFGIVFILIMSLSGCPDKNTSQKKDETEKIPNTMEKISEELEQVITLLGGPVFDSRDRLEQMKSEQMQMLSKQMQEKPEQSSLGTDKNMQAQDDSKNNQNNQNQEKEKGQDSEKGGEKEQGGAKDKEGEKGQSGEKDEMKEGQAGGEEKKTSGEEGSQEENKGEEMDAEKPPAPETEEKPFQFEDSLFGIAQWKEENWKMIKVLADSMYFSWNRLQPQLMEKGVSQMQMGNFITALESLSKSVQNKSLMNAQNSAAGLLQSLADFYSYFRTKTPPEIQRISSNITGIHFSVRQGDWTKAQELSNQMQQEFTKLKSSVEDNQSDLIKMLELSLTDLSSSVQKQDASLVMLRTNLVTANLRELGTKLSEDSQDSEQ